ncbi:hypothetical protein [Oceanicoccus sagamiensis]|uniref:hypothetical protein n=1 Tax=Oceanicoccus sagamiensis TaxID=716816 RepID=UPI00146A47A0|nr:hypothetical protein [Oceanicoccus sagamiensis]
MSHLITLLVLALSTSLGWASCQQSAAPGMPNPDMASEYEMLQAQIAVKNYLATQEQYLNCVQSSRKHNQIIDRMHEIADQYNRKARRYKARMESQDMITELALLDLSI